VRSKEGKASADPDFVERNELVLSREALEIG
jgi:hypothetical protein